MKFQGLTAIGYLQGLRPTMWDGKVNGYELGIITKVDDGFGGQKDEQIIIKAREESQSALQNMCNHARGKRVAISISTNCYKTQKGAVGFNLNYVPDSIIHVLNDDDVDIETGEVKKSKVA